MHNFVTTSDVIETDCAHKELKGSVALVYMPWGSFTRGSVALGILKRCAERVCKTADVHYLNVQFASKIGLELYDVIARNSTLQSEWFFSPSVYGDTANAWRELARTNSGRKVRQDLLNVCGSEEVCCKIQEEIVPQFVADLLTTIPWQQYDLIGFSVTFAQTMASLLIAKRVKELMPHKVIVLGGANVDSEMGFELLKAFPWVNHVVHGEAEESFPLLLQNILIGKPAVPPPGVSYRSNGAVIAGFQSAQPLANLDGSPVPDYSDYLMAIENSGIQARYQVRLPIESSRGCWWGVKHHCTFCGLNRDGIGFRRKSADRVYDEILELSARHNHLNFAAVDNILDMSYFSSLLPRLARADVDLTLFYEVKANLTRIQVAALADAGIKTIQPGIESLNAELLTMMRKGVKPIQNIQLLKWCREENIDVMWNILYGFPGETASHYTGLPDLLRTLFHLQPPLGLTPIVVERFSPYHFDRDKFGLKLAPAAAYEVLYPEGHVDLEKIAYYFEAEWQRPDPPVTVYMRPVEEAWQAWKAIAQRGKCVFFFEKGPNFVRLYDNRPLENALAPLRRILLKGAQAAIYLFCDDHKSLDSIVSMLKNTGYDHASQESVALALSRMVEAGLMYEEENRYLSLAVRKERSRRRSERIADRPEPSIQRQ